MSYRNLQICFVLDCTASMQPWIDAAKEKVVDILDSIYKRYPDCQISASFIGYRDFHDEHQFIKVPFTQNIEHLQTLIMNIEAEGGDDVCEDVAGAYRLVNGLEWDCDIGFVFHITDAPNHGIEYHESHVEDDYVDGHPYIDLVDEVQCLADKGIDLTVFKIKQSTDVMYNIMRTIYQTVCLNRFNVVNLQNRRYNTNDVFYSEISQRILYSMSSDPNSP